MRTVLCFGDSNTHGTVAQPRLADRARFPFQERWTSVAAAALGPGWRLIAEGQPGRTTVHPDPVEGGLKAGDAALPIVLESHRPLDAVAIMLGTNDLKRRFGLPAGDIASSVGRLVDLVTASDAGPEGQAPAVLVICPPPILETGAFVEMFEGGAAVSRTLAPRLEAVAAERGAAFLDAGAVAAVDPVDGIHLTAAAHAAIGRAVAGKLRALLAPDGETTGGEPC